jgi:hypothetical protein
MNNDGKCQLTDSQLLRIDILPLGHLKRDELYCQMMEILIAIPSRADKGFFKWIKRLLTKN